MASARTQQRMAALVRQWDASGEPRRTFARRHGLTVSQFDYWKREVRRRALDRADEAPAGFAPVHVIDGIREGDDAGLEVVFRGGERLTIPAGTSPDVVHAVILALRAPC